MGVAMRTKATTPEARLRRVGLAGLAFGVLALVTCELPVIVLLLGLFGAGVLVFELPPLVEIAGLTAGVIGIGCLLAHAGRRLWKKGDFQT